MNLNRTSVFAIAVTLFLGLSISVTGQQTSASKRLTVELFLDWEMVRAPQISPDGKQIVYSRRWTDKVNDKYEDEIWIMDSDGGRNRFLVKGSGPKWSSDGKRIAYIAPGQPTGAQIFLKWIDAPGETQLTRLERGPSNLAWSADGKQIAFNMMVPADPGLTVKMPARPSGAKWVDPPRVVDRLSYRGDGSGWRPEGFTHIFVISDQGGTPRQLTSGHYQHGAPEWLPNSRTIVFSGVRKPDAEYIRGGQEIYAVDLAGGPIRALTDRDGPDLNPTVSPDGGLIAYTGFDQNNDTYNVARLYLMNVDGSGKRVTTGDFDRVPNGLFWSEDSGGIYFTAEDRGSQNLWFQSIKGGLPQQVTLGEQILTLSSRSRDGLVVGTRTASDSPSDVISLRIPTRADKLAGFTVAPKDLRQLTAVNADLLQERKLGEVEEIWYDSVAMAGQQQCVAVDSSPVAPKQATCEATRIQGWIVKPPDFDPAKKYPLLLYIHGGPHAMYSVGFNFEFHNHAAENYIVLYTNPRGSSGYGKVFGNAINNAYPGDDYADLMRGVDELIKRGYIDERNLFVTGGSGGGVLTTWIVGHTDRFAAAVAMKPVTNWYSFVGTTDGSTWYYNFKELPWDDPAEHLRRSPLTYVGRVKTPTMILTGDLDLRTPLEQTEQYYRALKLRKVPTAMVRLMNEYHGFNAEFLLRHPSNRVAQILYLRGWFEKFRK